MRVIRTLLLALAVAIAAALALANDANPTASAFMQSLATSAIKQVTDPTISQGERRARFHQLLDAHFDMAAITKFVLGRYWRSATEDQRTEFRRLFEDFLVQTYTARFAFMSKRASVWFQRVAVEGDVAERADVAGGLACHGRIGAWLLAESRPRAVPKVGGPGSVSARLAADANTLAALINVEPVRLPLPWRRYNARLPFWTE